MPVSNDDPRAAWTFRTLSASSKATFGPEPLKGSAALSSWARQPATWFCAASLSVKTAIITGALTMLGLAIGLPVGLTVANPSSGSGSGGDFNLGSSIPTRVPFCAGTHVHTACDLPQSEERVALNIFPPVDESAIFVDDDGFTAHCNGSSPAGFPPCSALCSSYQGTINAISAFCKDEGFPISATNDNFWPEFKVYYKGGAGSSLCQKAADYVLAFSRILNFEFNYQNSNTRSGSAYYTSVVDNRDASGFFARELTVDGVKMPLISAAESKRVAFTKALTDAGQEAASRSFYITSQTLSQHYDQALNFAPVTGTVLPEDQIKLVEYSGSASDIAFTCSHYPENYDICLASRRAYDHAKLAVPVCYETLAQTPFVCTRKGQRFFRFQSTLLGLEKQLAAAGATEKQALCATAAFSPEAIVAGSVDASWNFLFASESLACFVNPNLLVCGAAPLLSKVAWKQQLSWWATFLHVHIGAIASYCPANTYLSVNPQVPVVPDDEATAELGTIIFKDNVIDMLQLADIAHSVNLDTPVSGTGDNFPFPTPVIKSECASTD